MKEKPIVLSNFTMGIGNQTQIGTGSLKKLPDGYFGYAQNINISNDSVGRGYVVPGFGGSTITNNSQISGTIIGHAHSVSNQMIDMIPGLSGNTDRIFRISQISDGNTPILAGNLGAAGNAYNISIVHSGHLSTVLHDIINYNDAGTEEIYITGRDATDKWLAEYPAGSTNPTITYTTFTDTGGTNAKNWLFIGDDDVLYMSKNNRSIVASTSLNNTLVNLKIGQCITGMYKWGTYMAIPYCEDYGAIGFAQRNNKGSSGIAIWNYIDNRNNLIDDYKVLKDYPYISAAINDINGNLIIFAGRRSSKTALFLFTGNGYKKLTEYIGDMPLSRHSVSLDGDGRIVWVTVDGQMLRYDIQNNILEHIYSQTASNTSGTVLFPLLSSTNQWGIGSNIAGQATIKFLSESSYIGDSLAGTNASPYFISPLISLPDYSKINKVTVYLKQALSNTGDTLQLRMHYNGNLTSSLIGTLDYATDGTISFKEFGIDSGNVNNFAVRLTWGGANATSSVPILERIEVHWTK